MHILISDASSLDEPRFIRYLDYPQNLEPEKLDGGYMKEVVLSMVLGLIWLSPFQIQQSPQTLQARAWVLNGNAVSDYVMEASGLATDPNGATVSLRSATGVSGKFGSATSSISAGAVRQRRVTIAGELHTHGAGGASLWLRVDHDKTALLFDNGSDEALRGDVDWTRRSVSFLVPADATAVVFGVLLKGGGSVDVRNLRLETRTQTSAPAKAVLDAAISIVKQNALRRNDVSWKIIEPQVRVLAAGAETTAEVYPAIRYLLTQLGDHHSFFMPPAQTKAFQTGGSQNPSPEVRALPEGIGYICVPEYFGAEPGAVRAYATRLHNSISATMASATCGWVVDLRNDTGGNMWPMLAGLKPFLGEAGLGSFVSPTGAGPMWIAGQGVGADPPPALRALESAWVVVLTGPRTASSGEAVTIAFRERPHTRSFGLPTAGLSSSNHTYPLPDGAMILLTTAIDADRSGRRYGNTIDPDELVENGGNATAIDATLLAATKWLKESSGCSRRPQ